MNLIHHCLELRIVWILINYCLRLGWIDLRSHAGHFFCVFPLITWFLFFFWSFWAEAMLFLVYIHILAVGNTPYGKCHTSRTIFVTWHASVFYLRRKLTFTQISWYDWQINLNCSILQPDKRLSDERYKYHSSNLKNVRVLAPPTLFNVGLRRQCQSLTHIPTDASL